jgi:hypothetical protein
MRSLLWTAVFGLLVVELCLTLILVIPVPRKIRSMICNAVSKLELKKRFKTPLVAIFFALVFAVLDTAIFLGNIYTQKEEEKAALHTGHNNNMNVIDRHLLKEREYKAGRNMYLAGFALTLLFVIGRITDLMQEHAELEGKIETLTLAIAINNNSSSGDNDVPSTKGIEMKPMRMKKKE